jgi:imidazolonepropionase-like amidohydrolase
MLVANHAIGITGGHCDQGGDLREDAFPDRTRPERGIADGVDEVRKAVRNQIKFGADVIKICATAGVLSPGTLAGNQQMDAIEMRTAVEEAARAGRKVAAHAHGNEGIAQAVQAGVASIEHGSMLDRRILAMMRERGTFLVPTSYVGVAVLARADRGELSPASTAKARTVAPRMRESFALAIDSGVKIALGSDAGVFPHGDNGREFSTMVELGMAPMAAIVAGTSAGAELLGLSDVGRIANGFVADIVIIDGDPLADITLLHAPAMVMKGGHIHVEPRWLQPQPK